MRRLFALGLVALSACLESPQSEVAYSAFATSDLASSFEANGVRVKLSRAEFAFGPAYFCAASSGSSALCKSALGEIVQVSRIDLLAPGPQALGTVKGFTGQVRSVSYDLGLHWFDTSFAVEPSSAAPEAHSMVFEGTLARAGVELRLELAYKGTARFDEGKVTRVVHNLARNAAEAMAAQGGGTFVIRVEREGQGPLVMTFSDTGPGIPKEIRHRLFQSFVTSGKKGGTGLGLAITKKIAEEHGGTIEVVASPSGTGATFRFTLPQGEGAP